MRFLGRIGVALAASILALAVLEVVTRAVAPVYLPAHPRGFYVADSTLVYRMATNRRARLFLHGIHVQTNSLGLRDRDYGRRTPGIARVLMLGDSQTFGMVEADETLPRLLERALAERGIQSEVVNAGVPGYGTEQELALLRRLLPAYRPDVVIVTVFANDIEDNGMRPNRHWRVGDDGYLHDLTQPPLLAPPRTRVEAARQWAVTHVNLAALAWSWVSRAKVVAREGRAAAAPAPPPYVPRLLARTWDVRTAREWAATDSLLRRVVRTAKAAGATPILLCSPPREALGYGQWPAGTDTTAYDLDRFERAVDAVAARTGAVRASPTRLLRQDPRPDALYIPRDEHWSAAGNALAVRALAPIVQDVLADRAPLH